MALAHENTAGIALLDKVSATSSRSSATCRSPARPSCPSPGRMAVSPTPKPGPPERPAYQQITDASAELRRPLRVPRPLHCPGRTDRGQEHCYVLACRIASTTHR